MFKIIAEDSHGKICDDDAPGATFDVWDFSPDGMESAFVAKFATRAAAQEWINANPWKA